MSVAFDMVSFMSAAKSYSISVLSTCSLFVLSLLKPLGLFLNRTPAGGVCQFLLVSFSNVSFFLWQARLLRARNLGRRFSVLLPRIVNYSQMSGNEHARGVETCVSLEERIDLARLDATRRDVEKHVCEIRFGLLSQSPLVTLGPGIKSHLHIVLLGNGLMSVRKSRLRVPEVTKHSPSRRGHKYRCFPKDRGSRASGLGPCSDMRSRQIKT